MFTEPYELAITVQDAGAQPPLPQSMNRARRKSARRGAKLLLRLFGKERRDCAHGENPCSIQSLWNHDNATSGKNYTQNVKCVRRKRAILDENMNIFLDLPASHEYPLFTLLYRRCMPLLCDCPARLRVRTGCNRWR